MKRTEEISRKYLKPFMEIEELEGDDVSCLVESAVIDEEKADEGGEDFENFL